MSIQRIPTVPLILGFSGTLPFAAATIVMWNGPASWQPTAVTVMTAYAFIILAFLGGVHWGTALSRGRPWQFVWSVVPSLIALAAALFALKSMLAILAAAYLLAGVVDVTVFRRDGPSWYVTLRIWLTIIVAPLILAAAFAPRPAIPSP